MLQCAWWVGNDGGTSTEAHGAASASLLLVDGSHALALSPDGGEPGEGNMANEEEERDSKLTTRAAEAGKKTRDGGSVADVRSPASSSGDDGPASGKMKNIANKEKVQQTGDTGKNTT